MSTPKKIFQSASRNETHCNCTALYCAKYVHKIPDIRNDGASRGSVCHDVLEPLLKPRHKAIYSAAVHHQNCHEVPALWRYIRLLGRKYHVADEENLGMIDDFIMVALNNSFFGPQGTIETFGEREFSIEVDEDGKRYAIRGFIDASFIVKDKRGLLISVRDYKGSAKIFTEEKLSDNMQAKIYQLALKRLHPDISRREFKFGFLRFPKKYWQESPVFTDEQLEGFEYVLTEFQERLENFTAANALDDVAAKDPERQWLCGRAGTKKDGKPMWMCGARLPMRYDVAVKNGEIVRSAFFREGLLPLKEGETVEERSYSGCPVWFTPAGRPIQS